MTIMSGSRRFTMLGAIVMCAVALSACGGGGSTSAPLPAQPKTTSSVGQVAFSIVIPAQTPAAVHRKPAYVSPATQSVSFQVGTATPQVVAIVPGSANCPANGNGGYTCTADASVAAGANQTLTIKTYATTNGTGSVLSQNTITVTIVAAQTNPVTVSLNGVAASLALTVTPSASVSRCVPSTLTATWNALDASGITIIGPGTITNAAGTTVTPTLTTSDTTHFTVGTASGNTWPVSYNGFGGTGPMTLSATFTAVTTGSAPVAINAGSLLFTKDGGSVDVFAPPYTGAGTAITNGVYTPVALRVNSSCTLFVADYDLGEVTAYAPPYTGAPIATITATNPEDLALTAAGNLWVLSSTTASSASEYAPPYTGAAIATFAITGANGPPTPYFISVDTSNDVFITQQSNGYGSVAEYAPPYTGGPTYPNLMYAERAIVSPANNDLFVTTVGDYTGVLPPPYTSEAANIAPGTNAGANGLALDAQGNLFVAYGTSNTVGEYAPPYTGGAAAVIFSGVDTPQNIAIDPATGNLFVANDGRTPNVTVYVPPYTGAPTATVGVTGTNGALAISP
jgi:hypothetical protein